LLILQAEIPEVVTEFCGSIIEGCAWDSCLAGQLTLGAVSQLLRKPPKFSREMSKGPLQVETKVSCPAFWRIRTPGGLEIGFLVDEFMSGRPIVLLCPDLFIKRNKRGIPPSLDRFPSFDQSRYRISDKGADKLFFGPSRRIKAVCTAQNIQEKGLHDVLHVGVTDPILTGKRSGFPTADFGGIREKAIEN